VNLSDTCLTIRSTSIISLISVVWINTEEAAFPERNFKSALVSGGEVISQSAQDTEFAVNVWKNKLLLLHSSSTAALGLGSEN
jgi:hypothetical protein